MTASKFTRQFLMATTIFAVLLLVLGSSIIAHAQQITATIVGTVPISRPR